MEKKEILKYFCNIVQNDPDISVGVAAIRTLMEIIKHYKSGTVQGLDGILREGVEVMRNADYPVAAINSGCELFLRFITFSKLDTKTFEECKEIMLQRGNLYLENSCEARGKIISLASQFITNGATILTHSRSRVVLQTMIEAKKNQNKNFHVLVTVSAPDNSGEVMHKNLEAAGIPCTLVLDSAIGYVMEQVDFVMVGAEGVVESGGIVNKVGTYTMGVCAREMNKSFYVLTESFKFSRLFPLNQQDLPSEYRYTSSKRGGDLQKTHPLVDYTPPLYITLLFTDIGVLTPSAVSDELINLYL